MNNRLFALSAAFAVLALDQLTKHWALMSLVTVGTTIKLAGPIDLTLVFNRSNAFGLVPDYGEFSRWALSAVSLVVAAVLLRSALRPSTSTMNAVGFALIGRRHRECC
ncbi:signal peptidase II [Bradyrhizobium sp. Leo121]|uniref:signal peptidase II n=1 Tax=Bradyrhizobium sp. Leo121 TaxID=1571195 RepID=UPI0013EF58FE|nr:signal peptidase II [Bradyrhizobium sp. Leo121]